MLNVHQAYRNFERYRQILSVLLSYGFDNIVNLLHLDSRLTHIIPVKRTKIEKVQKLNRAQRLRNAIEELGPTFIKLAQILSSRPDLIPLDFVEEFTKLQDAVSPLPFEEIEVVLREELGDHWEERFATIEREPLASASIAQVYKAELHSGEPVVIKIQRPGIDRKIHADLDILFTLARLAEEHSEDLKRIYPMKIAEEFSRAISRELDFTVEESNIELFQAQFRKSPDIIAPSVISTLTTKRVLTMEFIDGVKPGSAEKLREHGLDPIKVASLGAQAVMEQVFDHGFFHADPHPGNILILPENRICFIDFGQVGRVTKRDREEFAGLLKSLILRDDRRTAAQIIHFTDYHSKPDMEQFEREITELIDIYISRPIDKVDTADLLQQIQHVLMHFNLSLKPHIYLMMKSVATVEGLGRSLDPGFRVGDFLLPFARKLWIKKHNPMRLSADFLTSLYEATLFLRDVPEELRELLVKARQGKMAVELKHSGFEALMSTLDIISNRITFAIIQAAIIIGSSLIIHSKIPPHWYGIPIIGLAGFLFAGVLGGIILVTILQKRRM